MLTKTWGEFPTAEEVKAAGVWERDGGRWWMTLKGIDSDIANLANVPYDFRTTFLDEFFEMIKRIKAVSEMDEAEIAKAISRYSQAEVKEEAMSLASSMMQVGVGVEWV
jgi:hypothetical protein